MISFKLKLLTESRPIRIELIYEHLAQSVSCDRRYKMQKYCLNILENHEIFLIEKSKTGELQILLGTFRGISR